MPEINPMAGSTRPHTPTAAWRAISAGNERFVQGKPLHPIQGAERRFELTGGQQPFATIFGCSDSRVAAEVIFDRGLGDLFVIRTAGHVAGPTEIGSLEYGSEILGIPLIIVLGHDSCGAVSSAITAFETGQMPHGFVRDLVERVTPSVNAAYRKGATSADEIEAEHVRATVHLLRQRSRPIAKRIENGSLAIVGLVYKLSDGAAQVLEVAGRIDGLESSE